MQLAADLPRARSRPYSPCDCLLPSLNPIGRILQGLVLPPVWSRLYDWVELGVTTVVRSDDEYYHLGLAGHYSKDQGASAIHKGHDEGDPGGLLPKVRLFASGELLSLPRLVYLLLDTLFPLQVGRILVGLFRM